MKQIFKFTIVGTQQADRISFLAAPYENLDVLLFCLSDACRVAVVFVAGHDRCESRENCPK